MYMIEGCSVFFVFQAEDGIRDKLVTGVQTCALPISCRRRLGWIQFRGRSRSLSQRTLHHFTESDGLSSLGNYYPISFAEDHAGGVWVGFSFGGGLARYRNGRFTRFTADDGLASGGIFNLFVDSSHRLWIPTTRGGVCRIDHPDAEHPSFATYTTADGLSSDDVKAIVEDRWGRVYLGTGRAIDRFDAATSYVRHFTANEGALLGDVQAASQDRDGALWFSYATGLVKLVPEPDFQPAPAPVLIT